MERRKRIHQIIDFLPHLQQMIQSFINQVYLDHILNILLKVDRSITPLINS